MKNLPARQRPGRRSRSSYNRSGKLPYQYPHWVTAGERPPETIRAPLRFQWLSFFRLPLPQNLERNAL